MSCSICNNCTTTLDKNEGPISITKYYKLNFWSNETNPLLLFSLNGLIPDLFRKCFTTCIIEDCENFCSYNEIKRSKLNYYLGNESRNPDLINKSLIQSLFYFGFSSPSFKFIKEFSDTAFRYIDNDVIRFNKLIYCSDNSELNFNSSQTYFNNHQVTFYNYFNLKFKSTTLLYQFINFILLLQTNYDYFVINKFLIDKFEIPWEYSLTCNNSNQNNITPKITNGILVEFYLSFRSYLGNGETNNYNKKIFILMKTAIDVARDVYKEFLVNFNYRKAPLYNRFEDKCYYCPKDYMKQSEYYKCKDLYTTYLTNKSLIYERKFINKFNINIGLDTLSKEFNSYLVNILFIKTTLPNIVKIEDREEYFKNNYKKLNYEITDEIEGGLNIENYYFLEHNEEFNLDLEKYENILCWNSTEDVYISNIKTLIKDFNYNKNINLKIMENISINIFYV